MKKSLILFIIIYSVSNISYAQQSLPCSDKNLEPSFSSDVRAVLEINKEDAKNIYLKNLTNADALIWYGRRTAYLGQYNEAINIFTKGIETIGDDPRFYRHRGHRYISIRCFEKAISDFKKAAELTKGKPDEIEPDGIPNALNSPTSTLQTNIWYHLGLTYYLTKNWEEAVNAFSKCLNLSKNNDMYVASVYWLNMSYRRNGQIAFADSMVKELAINLPLIENKDYYEILLVYKGVKTSEDLYKNIMTDNDNLSTSSAGYGLSVYYYFNNEIPKAQELLNRILLSKQIASFGYIAAEAEKF